MRSDPAPTPDQLEASPVSPRAAVSCWVVNSGIRAIPAALLVLGAAVLTGWFADHPLLAGMVPGFPPMVIITALMFIASGLALLALDTGRRRVTLALGLGVFTLAAAVVYEYLSGRALGIDVTRDLIWADEGLTSPGRPALSTALAFLLGGLTLAALSICDGRRARMIVALASMVIVVAVAGGLGLVLGMDAFYPNYIFRGMAIPTALAVCALGLSLLQFARRCLHPDKQPAAEERIVSLGALLLVVVAVVTGLPVVIVVQSQLEKTLASGLRTSVDGEAQMIDIVLTQRSERAALVTSRPMILNALRELSARPGDPQSLASLESSLSSFLAHGFSGLRITDAQGQVITSVGHFVTRAFTGADLGGSASAQLLWQDGFFLRNRNAIRDHGQTAAIVETEQSLPVMQDVLSGSRGLGETGELLLCQRQGPHVRCFPSRLRESPFDLPEHAAHDLRLADLAQKGGAGMDHGSDYDGNPVVGVFASVGTHGLFVILKMDAVEVYGPLRRKMELSLLLAALVVFTGSMLFRAMVRPIAGELASARLLSQQRSLALERSHAFQRAVFEHAPDGILVTDPDGRIIEANERMVSLFGYAREKLHQLHIEDLVPTRYRGAHGQHRRKFQHAPSTRPMSANRTLTGQRADGTEFPLDVALAPLHTDRGERVIAIVKDMTEARLRDQQIQAALREKDLLLGEIHHRVKNNLQIVNSLLDLQVSHMTEGAATTALRDSQNRVQSMALIHQTLYQSHDFAAVEFNHFLETLVLHLQGSYGRGGIELRTEAANVRLPIDRAIPCGLIVNELVTNALKHAFPHGGAGMVEVSLRLIDVQHVEVVVSDDGIGLPASLDLENVQSLGMQLVQILAEQLHAHIDIQRAHPTRFTLRFALSPEIR